MTKEKIIEIVNACVQYNANQGTWSIDNRFADELFALIDQEKKDVVKEVLQIILKCFNYWKVEQNKVDAIMTLANEYGVEL